MIEYRASEHGDYDLILHPVFRLPSEREEFRASVEGVVRRFEEFLAAGGVTPSGSGITVNPYRAAEIVWSDGAVEIRYATWPFSDEGLGVVLRMLEHAFPDAARSRVIVEARADLLPDLEGAEEELPRRKAELPFALEWVPFTWWINLECQFDGDLAPHVPRRLDTIIRLWGEVASLGAFQVSWLPDDQPNGEFGVGVQGPTVGDDFLQWQCAITGVNPASSDALVNLIAEFSATEFPLKLLYLG